MTVVLRQSAGRLSPAIVVLIGALAASPAHATLTDGYLAECTAVATGSCTELTGGSYARQPISFQDAVKGVSNSSVPYSFGGGAAGTIVGRAVYDAPTGGNLMLVIPLATPVVSPPVDQSDVGAIKLTITALQAYQSAKVVNTLLQPGVALGTSGDGSVVSSGVKLAVRSGYLAPAYPSFDASGVNSAVLSTGFAITTITNQAHYVINGAATLATGAVQLPTAPYDGQSFVLACNVTVTALTVTAAAPATISSTPTTCGPASAHEFFYTAAGTKWTMLF